MVLAHLTALAQGFLLVAGLTLSTGLAQPGGADVAGPISAIRAPVTVVGGGPTQRVANIAEWAQAPHPLALESEDPEVEGTDGRREPEGGTPLTVPPIARLRPHGSGPLLVGRDAVASHAPRGPPAA